MRKGEVRPDLWKARVGVCPICGKEFRAVKDYRERHQIYCSDECRKRRSQVINQCKFCGKDVVTYRSVNKQFCDITCRNAYYAEHNKGAGSPAWKGGKTTEAQCIKGTKRYKEWREAVFRRDGYTCQSCGAHGVYLEAHHIKSKSKYPKFMFDVDNGVTLCHECHAKTDTYGSKARKRADLSRVDNYIDQGKENA